MKKSVPLSFACLLIGIGGVVGYQTLQTDTNESTQVVFDAQVEQPVESSTLAQPPAQQEMKTSSSSMALVSTDIQTSTSMPDIDESRAPQPPRQASDISRAPTSAPSAGEDYAHHPRPGTAQPILAPVSIPPQPAGN